MRNQRTPHHGIRTRHGRGCRAADDGRCTCRPSYEAWAYSAVEMKKLRKSFPTLAAAKAWRADALVWIRTGSLRTPSDTTLREAAAAWLEGAKTGLVRNRSGDPYKPSALRTYELALNKRLLPTLGAAKLAAITHRDLQDLADRLLAEGLDPSTIRNTLMPLRAIYRRALARGDVAINPTSGLELPAIRGRRDRIVSPDQAAALLNALPESERTLWATALYSGLRRGELMALRFEDIDLDSSVIRVRRSWDRYEGEIEPKSRAGTRTVPITRLLKEHLLTHTLRCRWRDGLVFGRSPTWPFEPVTTASRAAKAWHTANLQPITLHQARHTFASLMIAAGVNAKALSTYIGHASITITLDRYGHLMPGNETQAANLLDTYLTAGRAAQPRALTSAIVTP